MKAIFHITMPWDSPSLGVPDVRDITVKQIQDAFLSANFNNDELGRILKAAAVLVEFEVAQPWACLYQAMVWERG